MLNENIFAYSSHSRFEGLNLKRSDKFTGNTVSLGIEFEKLFFKSGTTAMSQNEVFIQNVCYIQRSYYYFLNRILAKKKSYTTTGGEHNLIKILFKIATDTLT